MKLNIKSRNLILAIALPLLLDAHLAEAGKLFTLDAASFRQRGGLIYQEIYFMIQRDRLKFLQTADGFESQYRITVELYSPDTLLATTSWEMVDKALKLEDITPRQKLPDMVVFNLAPGSYSVKGIVADLNRNTTHEGTLELDLSAFSDEELALSDIEFATNLKKGDEGSKFYKNGFLVIPNPERMYGTSLPMLYYYSEIYNLEADDGVYTVERRILDDARDVINILPKKSKKKVGSSVVEIDGFSITSLTSGTYYLQLIARDDDDTSASDTADAKFFIYRPEDFVKPAQIAAGAQGAAVAAEINSYNEGELQQAVDVTKYFLTDKEWEMVGGLNDDGRREFLIRFYNERDPDPATPVNEFRVIIVERKEYANKKFGIWDKPGWKTNRGRVYMLYGSRNNFGDYWLVHSNKQGEVYGPKWFEAEALVRRP
jgi:GWxTD domain-containing protein